MAAEEREIEIRRSIEEKLGVAEAAYVIGARPPGGWDSIVTKEYLDLRLDGRIAEVRTEMAELGGGLRAEMAKLGGGLRAEMAELRGDLRAEMHRETKTILRWLVPTIFSGLAAFGAIISAFD